MTPDDTEIIADVGAYYTGKLREHGASPQGVDWNGEQSQRVRFDQLLKVCPDGPFSLLDYGCGYGALLDHLGPRAAEIDFVGYDISEAMVQAARERHPAARFTSAVGELAPADVVVASGIFNVRLEVATEQWERYVSETLDTMRGLATRGFAFNMLTAYSDADRMRDYLFYPDPARYFDLCKRRFSRNVALLHDYELYEFTILVRLP